MTRMLFFVSILMIGCTDSNQIGAGQIELVYWCAPNPQEVLLAQTMVEEWHRTNPNIRIKVQPLPAGQSSEEVLLAA